MCGGGFDESLLDAAQLEAEATRPEQEVDGSPDDRASVLTTKPQQRVFTVLQRNGYS